MENVHFNLLNNMDISFFNLASIFPTFKNGSIVDYTNLGRDENLLYYSTHGERIYTVNGQEMFKIKEGDILFAPAKSQYKTKARLDSPDDRAAGICIKFDIKDETGNLIIINDPPIWVTHDIDGSIYESFIKLHNVIMQGSDEKLYSKALLSQLMNDMITNNRLNKSFNKSFQAIYPAVIQIEHYPQDHISITELADMCFLCESTFRRKFKQYTGVSPSNYRNKIRIQKALELIRSKFYTIENAAEIMGFTDQAHLSNIIKKATGKTTKEIKNLSKTTTK